jgi:uncharacterized protein
MFALQNTRTGEVLAGKLEFAHTRAERRKGCIQRERLEASGALVLSPCCAVHTARMRFAIDVLFLDHEGTVIQMVEDLSPWRTATSMFAHTAIALAGGSVRWRDIIVGDRLCIGRPAGQAEAASGEPAVQSIIVWSDRHSNAPAL